jgi:hypothetical protein
LYDITSDVQEHFAKLREEGLLPAADGKQPNKP